jgi:3-deoxy-7-phosphoheptulonate synthase
MILGPCSIHDVGAAIELSHRMKELADEVQDKFLVIGRFYFEKPRTVDGWKGMISDPHLDGSYNMNTGLDNVLKVVTHATNIGVPVASEFLNTISPTYYTDFVSWAAIGARNSGAQVYRELVSGLSMPVGFKNCTSGDYDKAIKSMIAAMSPKAFLGIDPEGRLAIVSTKGNSYTHLVLRGSESGPNYSASDLEKAYESLEKAGICTKVLIDCSHDNTLVAVPGKDKPVKDYTLQPKVLHDGIQQINAGNNDLIGFMLESNLEQGSQPIPDDPRRLYTLSPEISVTDKCIGWQTTLDCVRKAYNELK